MPVMPDSRIPLGAVSDGPSQSGGLGGGTGGMFATLGGMMKIKEMHEAEQQRRLVAEQQQRALDDDNAIRSTLQMYQTPDEAITDLYKQGRAQAASKLGTSIFDARKKQLEAFDATQTSAQKRVDTAAQMLQGIRKGDNATYQTVRPAVLQLIQPLYGDAANDMLPTTYDEDHINALVGAGTKVSERMTAVHNGVTELQGAMKDGLIANAYGEGGALAQKGVQPGAKWSEAALKIQETFLKTASMVLPYSQSADEWNGRLDQLRAMGASPETLNLIPKWDDANPEASREAAKQLSLTPKDRAEIADRKRNDDETKRYHDASIQTDKTRAAAAMINAKANAADTGSGSRGITATSVANLRDKRNERVDALDSAYRPDSIGTDKGKRAVDPGENEDEYIARRLEYFDDYRENAENKPPMAEAAQQAVDAGDRPAYDAIAKEYATATKGRRTLGALVPWEPVPKTQEGREAAFNKLSTEFKNPKTTPARRTAIQAQIRKLRGE